MKAVLGFLGRRGAVYLLFVLALLAGQYRGLIEEPLRHRTAADELQQMISQLDAARQAAGSEVVAARAAAQGKTLQELDQQLALARKDLDNRQQARERDAAGYLIKRGNPQFELTDRVWALKVQAARYKVDGLSAVQAVARGKISSLTPLAIADDRRRRAALACQAANKRSADFNKQDWMNRAWQDLAEGQIAKLDKDRKAACDKSVREQAIYDRLRKDWDEALKARLDVGAWLAEDLPDLAGDLRQRAAREGQAAEAALRARGERFWREHRINTLLVAAFGLLVASMVTPFLIRIFFYYVLAPLAERRRMIRLRAPGSLGAAIPPSPPSSTSVQVRIGPDEELLVRQGFLQTTSVGGAKRTVALLDWRHPLASWLTGLVNLTSIRGEDQVTTVSAIHDPFSEVAVLTIPAGGALVLLPRALVAVVQPVGAPMRITAHWRLLSLQAWLTLQLRYFVFHGPVRLVIRGGRGVRVERAERGRVFAQDQLVGFSADLAYSIARAETFLPYFFGREALLKDRVDAGEGVLIVEEAPLSLRGRAEVKHGLEGAFDAVLKAVGI